MRRLGHRTIANRVIFWPNHDELPEHLASQRRGRRLIRFETDRWPTQTARLKSELYDQNKGEGLTFQVFFYASSDVRSESIEHWP